MANYAGRYDELLLRNVRGRLTTAHDSTVMVYESDGTTVATLYTDRTKATTAANPVDVDANGNLEFFAEPGIYVLSIREGGTVVATNTVTVGPDHDDIAAVNAVLNSDTSTAAMGFVVDEDDMVSNSATKLPTQQSVKAYVDAASTPLTASNYVPRAVFDSGAPAGAGAITANTAEFTRFYLDVETTLDRMLVVVGAQSGNTDFGIYNDDGVNGAPLTRLASTGSVVCPAAGRAAITLSASVTLAPGVYWAALAPDNATASFEYWTLRSLHFALGEAPRYRAASSFPLPATLASTTADAGGSAFGVVPAKS